MQLIRWYGYGSTGVQTQTILICDAALKMMETVQQDQNQCMLDGSSNAKLPSAPFL